MKSIHFIDFLLTLLEIKKFLKESFFSCTLKSCIFFKELFKLSCTIDRLYSKLHL